MAQFDVYRNNNPATQEQIPYLLDVQTDLIDIVHTRVVAPLEVCGSFATAARLNPVFEIEGVKVAMSTPELQASINEVWGNLFVRSQKNGRQSLGL